MPYSISLRRVNIDKYPVSKKMVHKIQKPPGFPRGVVTKTVKPMKINQSKQTHIFAVKAEEIQIMTF